MNGLQLIHLFSLDKATALYFKGIAMRDSEILPRRQADPALYILNTGSVTSRGEHWCAVYFENEIQEFFDPFGMPPDFYGFDALLKTRTVAPSEKRFNVVPLQSMKSIVCGHHCVLYAYHKCRGFSLEKVLSLYPSGKDREKNDAFALNFVLQFGSIYRPRL
jgi:hypothetical protein